MIEEWTPWIVAGEAMVGKRVPFPPGTIVQIGTMRNKALGPLEQLNLELSGILIVEDSNNWLVTQGVVTEKYPVILKPSDTYRAKRPPSIQKLVESINEVETPKELTNASL